MLLEPFRLRLRESGGKPAHVTRVLRAWLNAQPLGTGPLSAPTLPGALQAVLPELEQVLAGLAQVSSSHPGADGSVRLLVQLADGQSVESVLLPRDGVCVSTQLGCAVGCTFCMTGRHGLLRQLSSVEILAQVVLARRIRPVKKVVFMGMGEPAHNLDNVLEAIELLGTLGNIGHKNLVFSTVGDRRIFERLPQGIVKPALALSLHTTRSELRMTLLPKAPRFVPAELVELADAYGRNTGYPVQYQWTLIAGINDGDDEMTALAKLLKGRYGLINFIPYNPVEGEGFRRPSVERLAQIEALFRAQDVLMKFRQSAGQDVEGGCGQLRARSLRQT